MEKGRTVKYYILEGTVFAVPMDGSQDARLPAHAALMTPAEVEAHMDPPPVVVIPQTISRFQARAALLAAGLLSDVEAAVAAADPFAQLAWAEAQEWRRDSPTLLALAHGIGLTDADIDDLFVQAAAIRA